jgi:hypothetical protein
MFVFGVALPAQAALTSSQVQAVLSLLQAFGVSSTVVANVQAILTGQPPQTTTPNTTTNTTPNSTWTTNTTPTTNTTGVASCRTPVGNLVVPNNGAVSYAQYFATGPAVYTYYATIVPLPDPLMRCSNGAWLLCDHLGNNCQPYTNTYTPPTTPTPTTYPTPYATPYPTPNVYPTPTYTSPTTNTTPCTYNGRTYAQGDADILDTPSTVAPSDSVCTGWNCGYLYMCNAGRMEWQKCSWGNLTGPAGGFSCPAISGTTHWGSSINQTPNTTPIPTPTYTPPTTTPTPTSDTSNSSSGSCIAYTTTYPNGSQIWWMGQPGPGTPSYLGLLASQWTCNNGAWISTTPSYTSTTQPPAANCTTSWGTTIASGQSVTGYQNSSVAYGSQCISQSRTCSNGTLSGIYTYPSCTVAPAPTTSGSSLPAFNDAYGKPCTTSGASITVSGGYACGGLVCTTAVTSTLYCVNSVWSVTSYGNAYLY